MRSVAGSCSTPEPAVGRASLLSCRSEPMEVPEDRSTVGWDVAEDGRVRRSFWFAQALGRARFRLAMRSERMGANGRELYAHSEIGGTPQMRRRRPGITLALRDRSPT